MARRPEGPERVEKLEGSAEAKRRLRLVLETLGGQRTLIDACAQLGLSPARFAEVREQALRAALEGLEPKPAGRPPKAAEPAEVEALRAEIERLRIELKAAEVREEIAIALPHLLRKPGKKKARKRPRGSRGDEK